MSGLFTRGLTTRIAANGLQNICFTVLWRLVRAAACVLLSIQAYLHAYLLTGSGRWPGRPHILTGARAFQKEGIPTLAEEAHVVSSRATGPMDA